MGKLSPEVKKALSEGAVNWQIGADPDPVDHELVIHEIGWHLVHPLTCKAMSKGGVGGREQLTRATKNYRATGEVKYEPCRFQETAEAWTSPPAPLGVYRWKTPKGGLELRA